RLTSSVLTSTAATLASVEPQLIEPCLIQLQANGVISRSGEGQTAGSIQGSLLVPIATTGRVRVYAPTTPTESEVVEDAGLGLTNLVRAEERLARGLRRLAKRAPRVNAAQVRAWLAAESGSREPSAEQRPAGR